ncbi:MAG TPA: hypothetical protein VF981_07555 [Gemmatimonadaceae bacterium]
MNWSLVIDIAGLCAAIVTLLGAFFPRILDCVPAGVTASLVCLAFGASLSLEAYENHRIGKIADRALQVLHDRDATPDELHAALGDVTIGDVTRALTAARESGQVADKLVELLEPRGGFVTARVYFRVN